MNATEGKNEIITIAAAELPIRAMEMKEKGMRLSQACAAWVKKESKLELLYSFVDDTTYDAFTYRVSLEEAERDSDIRVVSSAYLRSLMFLPAILIPACTSSSPAFLMMYSA